MAIKGRVRGGLDPAADCAVECRDKRRRWLGVQRWPRLRVGGLGRASRSLRGSGVCLVAFDLQSCKELQDVGDLGVKASRPGSLVPGLGLPCVGSSAFSRFVPETITRCFFTWRPPSVVHSRSAKVAATWSMCRPSERSTALALP